MKRWIAPLARPADQWGWKWSLFAAVLMLVPFSFPLMLAYQIWCRRMYRKAADANGKANAR